MPPKIPVHVAVISVAVVMIGENALLLVAPVLICTPPGAVMVQFEALTDDHESFVVAPLETTAGLATSETAGLGGTDLGAIGAACTFTEHCAVVLRRAPDTQ